MSFNLIETKDFIINIDTGEVYCAHCNSILQEVVMKKLESSAVINPSYRIGSRYPLQNSSCMIDYFLRGTASDFVFRESITKYNPSRLNNP